MQRISLGEKTGFIVAEPDKPVIIRDDKGVLFYDTTDLLPRVEYFNLPPGEFFLDEGHIFEAPRPRSYKYANIPPPERDFGSMKDYKISFEPNPHKCTTYWDTKEIVFDPMFLERPLPQFMFILCHELGHRFYETEKYCDLYASNAMKARGYNPSQIADAQMFSLSSNQLERKEFVTENLIKTV